MNLEPQIQTTTSDPPTTELEYPFLVAHYKNQLNLPCSVPDGCDDILHGFFVCEIVVLTVHSKL